MNLYTIDTELFKLDGGAMFGVVPKTLWNKVNPADENNLTTWAMRLLLIEDEGRLILVDTGLGNKQSEKFFSYYYLHGDATLEKSLAAHGFHPNDITDVILTHLHFDHCGGAVAREGDRLLPAFKNATYWSNEKHWDWAVHPNEREKASFLKENILPLQESGRLQFIPTPDGPFTDKLLTAPFSKNVSVRFVGGHTESMMLPQVRYKDKTLVYMADLLPSVPHLSMSWVMAYDMFPLTTLQEKKAFLNEALEGDYILFFEHDRQVECCTLQRTERGIREKETFRLDEI
jgi:glyoxylase-like metal-dependent hydrolase (beta-lactamase superfamily II)